MSQGEIDLCGNFLYNLGFSTKGQKLVRRAKETTDKMSYAIIRTGGKQFPVSEGQILRVPTIEAEAGNKVDIETLVVGEGADAKFGSATLQATVVSHGRGDKIIVFKKKRRKQYKRKQGHRQGYTEIKIEKI